MTHEAAERRFAWAKAKPAPSKSELQAFPANTSVATNAAQFNSNGMGPDGYYSPLAFAQFAQQAGFQNIWLPNLATGYDGNTEKIVDHALYMFTYL